MAKTEKAAFLILIFLLTIGLSYKFYRLKNESVDLNSLPWNARRAGMVFHSTSSAKIPLSHAKKSDRPRIVNINLASVEDFDQLPYIGKPTAQRIVDYRNQHGPFKDKFDLLRVEGITISRYKKLEPYLTLE